ncbi:ABC transporter B family member 13 [Phoenix dactylifera]|uniref:ABC transporter B family member 13 n=1 Tax=Phoenix dactylifera TaxID=42345 RepID=A0A8B8ZI36_PHODC|nr:ABC transporter B family member 13 [Phoenix dactylifera]
MGFSSVWQLTLLTLAIVPLVVIAGGTYTIIMSSLSRKGEAAYAEAGKVAEEVISHIHTVCSYVGEERAIEAYSRSLKTSLKFGKKSGLAKGLGLGCTYGLLFCSWALLLWYAGILVTHGVTNGGKAFTTILNVVFSGFALGQAAPNLSSFAKGQAAAKNILSIIAKVPEYSGTSENGLVLPEIAGQIEFRQVSFNYPSRKDMVFNDLSFSISASKTIAIVGQSGSGKSTIISIIERFYEPTSGKVLLDGHDIKNLQLKWLRNQMGLVSQEPALFSTSIAENIIYGRKEADMEDIEEAAKVANAHSFIQDLPDGYLTKVSAASETISAICLESLYINKQLMLSLSLSLPPSLLQFKVGMGGMQLSGGQKQRIAIARALLRNPKILLLDEATSALDAESECLVQHALEKVMFNRTTVIVAHRLSTISNADTIMVLKNGKIAECGTHMELISKGQNGEYAMLVGTQAPVNNKERHPDYSKDSAVSCGTSPNVPENELKYEKENSVIIRDQESQESCCPPRSASIPSIWTVFKLNKSEWSFAILGSVGATLAGVEGPLFALGITHVLTAFYSHDKIQIKHEIKMVSLIFIGAAIITVPVYLLQHYFYTLMGEKLTTRVRLLMFSAILDNEIGWFELDENSSGSLTSSLAVDATVLRSALAERMSTMVQNISLTVTAFIIAFLLSWRMALVVVATFPLLISASIAEHLFLKGFGGNYTCAYSRANSVAQEAITNNRTVAAFGAEDQVLSNFTHELHQPNRQARLRGHISGVGYGLSQLFAFCSYALGLWYASQLLKHGTSDFSDIMKSFMVLIITALGVAEALALTPDIVKGSQALGSVFSLLERKTAINPDDPKSEKVVEVKGDIEFRNVTFRYPTRPDVTVLKDLNLHVAAGRSLAIVGRSGSGKSSLLALIMRFYDPSSGEILIDGKDIRGLNLRSLRQRIGFVQQEPALFSTTVSENIAYGKEGASEIEIMRASKAANAHGFISRLAQGYDTHVGERGTQLSGGQRQRVAIARAILKDPSILLLDEATSALDTASERQVQEALYRLMEGRTTVIVAHRFSTIQYANMIVVLQDGRVQETGTHEDLISWPGSVYGQLVRLQRTGAFLN